MRFMMLLRADADTEAGAPTTQEALEAMGKYNEELMKAGVLLDGAGLRPSSEGARVTFERGKPRVTDGPFTETKELIAGYWMIQVRSKEEAIEWARRVPFEHIPRHQGIGQIELRPLFELDDFEPGEALERHRRIMEEIGNE